MCYIIYYIDATTTQSSDCETGDVRLANGQPDPASNTLAGRLEVCINNAWGTVCNSRFDVEDAGTACEAIRGFSRDGTGIMNFVCMLIFLYHAYRC